LLQSWLSPLVSGLNVLSQRTFTSIGVVPHHTIATFTRGWCHIGDRAHLRAYIPEQAEQGTQGGLVESASLDRYAIADDMDLGFREPVRDHLDQTFRQGTR
jgi:hypothetical protein